MGKRNRKSRATAAVIQDKCGYDGQKPMFRPVRELADPEHKHRKADGPQNINIDRLEWLLAHDRIEKHQHAAGRKLQNDWEMCQISGVGNFLIASSGGNGGSSCLADAKLDAMGRYGEAMNAVGPKARRWLDLIVIENASLEAAAAIMSESPRGALPALQVALDVLGRHYGFC